MTDRDLAKPAASTGVVGASMLFLFFVTGSCGLIYEVVWTRLLRLVMGNTTLSITTVLCAFMGGLALGSYVGGRIADRRNDPLRVFAVIQGVIAVYCFALPWLIDGTEPVYRLLYRTMHSSFYTFSLIRFVLCGALLVVPATLMGATLPVLSRFFVRSWERAGFSIGNLYAVNTFGAVLGAFGTGFVLIPLLGVSRTIYLGCALSALAGAASYVLHRSAGAGQAWPALSGKPVQIRPDQVKQAVVSYGRGAMAAVLVGYAFAGAASMIYEITWARVLSLLIGSSVYAFSMMLTAFILGLALGSMVIARFVDRMRDPMRTLGLIEVAVGFFALLMVPFIDRLPLYATVWIARSRASFWQMQFVGFGLILLVMLVPTTLMGAAFPVANKLFVRFKATVGKAVGTVYCWNTMGCILGSLAGGFMLIPWLGIQRTIFVAVCLNVLVGGVFLCIHRSIPPLRRFLAAGMVVLVTGIAIARIPSWDASKISLGPFIVARHMPEKVSRSVDALREALRQSREVIYHKEGLTATVSVHKTPHDLILIINGKPDASAVGDLPEQDLLAHVPLLLHPEPRSALVIGLGSGITLGSAGLYPLERIDCVEISPEVIEACKFFEEYNYRILRDPRVRLIIADGRNHLALTDMKYDVIISEPSNPWIAGIADLFTREFFQLCYDRLTSQGVTCIWLEAYNIDERAFCSIVRTFQSVFPNMEIWGTRATNYLLIGFKGQGQVDYQVLAGRMQQHAIAEGLKRIHVRSFPEFFGHLIMGSVGARKLAGDAPVHTDDNALLEFSTPRTMIANPRLLFLWEAIEWHRGADLSFLTGSDDKALAAVRQQIQRLIEARGHVVMGTVFSHRKQPEQALQELRKAVSLNRSDAALVELVDLVLAIATDFAVEKQFDQAIKVCQRVVDVDPENAKAHFQLGQLLMRQRQADAAFEHFSRAVQLEPEHAPYRFVLATAAYEMGKVDAAIDHYRQTLRLKNDHAGAMNNLAWILASQPNSNPRDKDEAIKLAERACELTGRKDPKMLETLAAAYAGSGRFADAVAVAREAITLAEQANNQRLLQELRDRIELYGRQEPYRRAPRPGPK